MRLPRRIADLLKRKEEFIDMQRSRLENTAVRLQSQLFSDLLAEIIPELDIKDGLIQETAKNYRIISMVDKTFSEFATISNTIVLNQITGGTVKIASMAEKYFRTVLADEIKASFDSIISKTNKLINLRMGLDDGKLVRGGFLESFFKNNTVSTEVKDMIAKAVTSQMNIKELTKVLKENIVGTADRAGLMERQFRNYVFDIYQEYDRAYHKTLGDEFGMKYFVYNGSLIKDSRDFCVAHAGKVYSIEETEEWKTWTPSQGEYPEGYEVKQKDIYAVPSYIDFAGYDPIVDMGGYNCRHHPGFISDELAREMRPDLKEVN